MKIQFNLTQFITNPQVTQGAFYIGNEHTHSSMIRHFVEVFLDTLNNNDWN